MGAVLSVIEQISSMKVPAQDAAAVVKKASSVLGIILKINVFLKGILFSCVIPEHLGPL